MDLNTKVKAGKEVISTEMDGEAVLMHVSKGVYYGLNAVGAVIWDRLKQPAAVAEICNSVADEFEVEREVCERDVCSLLDQLEEAGLVEIVNETD